MRSPRSLISFIGIFVGFLFFFPINIIDIFAQLPYTLLLQNVALDWTTIDRSDLTSFNALSPQLSPISYSKQSDSSSPANTLMFIENVGQFSAAARFQVPRSNGVLWLAEDGLWITIFETIDTTELDDKDLSRITAGTTSDTPYRGTNIHLSFPGSNLTPQIEPFGPLTTTISYFKSNDPTKWNTNAPVWSGVRYLNLYPDIDLELSGSGTQLQMRLIAHDITALDKVRLSVEGADSLKFNTTEGIAYALELKTPIGELTLPLLTAVQGDGTSITTLGRAVIREGQVDSPFTPYAVPPLNPQYSPQGGLQYSTFLGGSYFDFPSALSLKASDGSVYITGVTESTTFPTTPGVFDNIFNGGRDVFISKLNANGTAMLYSTFLGGNQWESGWDVTIDNIGNAYVTGWTYSADFPTTLGAFDTSHNGGTDAFVTKLNPAGNALIYSTFLGGGVEDAGRGLSVADADTVIVTGETRSTNYPTTANAYDTTFNGGYDTFVTKLTANGSSQIYSTFIGGENDDYSARITLDNVNNAFIAGSTMSSDYPTTPDALDISANGETDSVITKLNATGNDLIYSTFLGGSDDESIHDISVDQSNNAYVTGRTRSADFPITATAYDTEYNGNLDIFVTKLNATGSNIQFSTYLGGIQVDSGQGIDVDNAGFPYITGATHSSDFPTTSSAVDRIYNGAQDAIVTKLNANGSDVLYSTYLGGSSGDYGGSIGIDNSGNAYITGFTESADFPTSLSAFDTTFNENRDGFVTKLNTLDGPPPTATPIALPLVDTGFHIVPDGYGFVNDGNVYPSDFTLASVRRMFGDDAVCVAVIAGICWPRAGVNTWVEDAHRDMQGGHCFGLTITSLRFFRGIDFLGDYEDDADSTYDLGHLTPSVRSNFSYYHATQNVPSVMDAIVGSLSKTPNQVLVELHQVMQAGNSDPQNLLLLSTDRQSGHSITPVAIEPQNNGIYRIKVYDNNYPSETNRYVVINTLANTWTYENVPNSPYGGDASTYNLGILPISLSSGVLDCPWCGNSHLGGIPTHYLRLHGRGHLLIANSADQRIGYVGETFLNEIPNAYETVVFGGLGVTSEPRYTLPVTDTYTIQMHGAVLTQTQEIGVTQFGLNYSVQVENVVLEPGSVHSLTIGADGKELRFFAQSGTTADISITREQEGVSELFSVIDTEISASSNVRLENNIDAGRFVVDNTQSDSGQYDFTYVRTTAAGTAQFSHAGISLNTNDTHYLFYGGWDGDSPLLLEIDVGSNGTIDETLPLENDLLTTYLPIIRR